MPANFGHLLRGKIQMVASADLNDYIIPGRYAVTAPTNGPSSGDFTVEVSVAVESDTTRHVLQTCRKVDSGTTSLREHNGSAWSDWSNVSGGSAGANSEILTANRDYYVRTDGDDANTGLADTAGGAWLTIQNAIYAIRQIASNGFTIEIHVGAGTYSEDIIWFDGNYEVGPGVVILTGDVTTPANVILDSSYNCISFGNTSAVVRGFTFTTTYPSYPSYGNPINCVDKTFLFVDRCAFAGTGFAGIYMAGPGIQVSCADITIDGDYSYFVYQDTAGSHFWALGTWTLAAARAFTSFTFASGPLSQFWSATFAGTGATTSTGNHHELALNAVVNTSGGGDTYFPGDVINAPVTGGQYV